MDDREILRSLLHPDAARAQRRSTFVLAALLLVLACLAAAWRLTPLAGWATLDTVKDLLRVARESPFAPAVVAVAFIVGGVVFFPITLLILAAGFVFGWWPGIPYAFGGSVLSSFVGYWIGRAAGKPWIDRLTSRRLQRIVGRLSRSRFPALVAVRMIPFAPFTVVNMASGAAGVRFGNYAVGSLLGMLPWVLLLVLYGDGLEAVLSDGTWTAYLLLASLATALALLGIWIGRAVRRRRARSHPPSDPADR